MVAIWRYASTKVKRTVRTSEIPFRMGTVFSSWHMFILPLPGDHGAHERTSCGDPSRPGARRLGSSPSSSRPCSSGWRYHGDWGELLHIVFVEPWRGGGSTRYRARGRGWETPEWRAGCDAGSASFLRLSAARGVLSGHPFGHADRLELGIHRPVPGRREGACISLSFEVGLPAVMVRT